MMFVATPIQGVVDMSNRFVLMLPSGFIVFVIGGLSRTYMNVLIGQSPLSDGSNARSTEIRYKCLIREKGARAWPLVVTVICVPLGILLAFAAIVGSNYLGAK
jgi:hypothetical protein